ncbi:hypothetical protein BDY19DRAFT_928865 [Irpex rosettiformis]|uniref:Uncharacterized protein n=1 Tax=Irpex rosettiformis TaxID=378272 RepID=A0ACB8UDU0_9APHY|nr:hypothetical protein BDY19DRAFT_928865 [Irpex rosettiformis]
MFQALSSFLPSALQLGGAQDKSSRPTVEPESPQAENHLPPVVDSPATTEFDHETTEGEKSAGINEQSVKKKKERTHESFIVVRPPPAKSNHPLNLQVQLVPPSSRTTLPRTSFSSSVPFSPAPTGPDSESFPPDTPLTRTTSNRSDVSAYSSMTSYSTSSTTSFSSVASGSSSSTSGGRRMIIPLYNLQAHNVMTNVIVDAGTDAKIAKFHKRGLEIIGLAMLDVVETTRGIGWADDRQGHPHQASLLSAEGNTPASSHVSLNSLSPAQTTPQPEKSGARRLFGRVFKKNRDASPVASPTANSPYMQAPKSPLPSIDRDASLSTTPKASNKRSSLLLAASAHAQSPSFPDPLASPASLQPQPQQTVLGIAPILHTPINGPDGRRVRPTRYVWVLRKWLKGPPSGVTLPTETILPGYGTMDGLVEVTFEWVRATSSRKDSQRVKSKERRRSSGVPSNTPSLSSLKRGQERRGRNSVEGERDSRRNARPRSTESARSAHTNTTATTEDGSPRRREDDGEDSDPEDSETPWMCQLVIRKLQSSNSHRLSYISTSDDGNVPAPPMTSVKVKVAAIVPAPHHPKVVSLLKIPFPLQDVILISRTTQVEHRLGHLSPHHLRHPHAREVEIDVEARRRIVTPQGVARPALYGQGGSPPVTPTQAAINSGNGAGLHKLAGKFKSTVASAVPQSSPPSCLVQRRSRISYAVRPCGWSSERALVVLEKREGKETGGGFADELFLSRFQWSAPFYDASQILFIEMLGPPGVLRLSVGFAWA